MSPSGIRSGVDVLTCRCLFLLPLSLPFNTVETNLETTNKMSDYQTYDLGDFKLKSGEVIPSARIAFKTFGNKDAPAIIYPTWYSGRMCF